MGCYTSGPEGYSCDKAGSPQEEMLELTREKQDSVKFKCSQTQKSPGENIHSLAASAELQLFVLQHSALARTLEDPTFSE